MRAHSLIWILITIAIFLLAPLLKGPEVFLDVLEAETQEAQQWYAPTEVQRISDRGDSIYRMLMIDTGLDPAIRKYLIQSEPPSQDMGYGTKLPSELTRWADQFLGYWLGLLCNVHLFCFRIAHSWVWMGYLVPFLAAIIFDGLMTRRAKIESFKYTSPTIYNASWHVMIAIVCVSIVYFALAMPISVFYYPVMITVFGLMTRALIGNIQHSA